MSRLPTVDPSGHPYLASVGSDGISYTLVFLGSDGRPDSYSPPASPYFRLFPADDFNHDIVFADGRFIVYPDGIAPN